MQLAILNFAYDILATLCFEHEELEVTLAGVALLCRPLLSRKGPVPLMRSRWNNRESCRKPPKRGGSYPAQS